MLSSTTGGRYANRPRSTPSLQLASTIAKFTAQKRDDYAIKNENSYPTTVNKPLISES